MAVISNFLKKLEISLALTYGDYVKNPAYQPYIKDSMATEKLFKFVSRFWLNFNFLKLRSFDSDRLGFVPDEETCILSSKEQYPKIVRVTI